MGIPSLFWIVINPTEASAGACHTAHAESSVVAQQNRQWTAVKQSILALRHFHYKAEGIDLNARARVSNREDAWNYRVRARQHHRRRRIHQDRRSGRHLAPDIFIGLEGIFLGSINFKNQNTATPRDIFGVAPWWLINSTLGCKVTKEFTVRLIVDNVFDTSSTQRVMSRVGAKRLPPSALVEVA
jgi:hypothetical protein